MELTAGTVVDGRYEVERLLGRGGQASVYVVRHTSLGSRHAMKVVEAHPAARARILQEGQMQATLKHAHIVRVTDVVEVEAALGLIMELVDGPDLARVVRTRKLGLQQVDVVARAVLSAMAVAHDHGLVHRDLKPENILLDRGANGVVPKVSDFGLALQLRSANRQTPTGAALGTPFYMSPEQVRDGRTIDHRADIWAIGAILYELLSGRLAFEGADVLEVWNAIDRAEPVPLESLEPTLPPRVLRTLERALKRDPDERFGSCRAMLASWDDTPEARLSNDAVIVDLDVGSFIDLPPPDSRVTWHSSAVSTSLALGLGVVGMFGIATGVAVVLGVLALGLFARTSTSKAPSLAAEATPLMVGQVPRKGSADAEVGSESPRALVNPQLPEAIEPVVDAIVAPKPPPVQARVGEVVAVGASVLLWNGDERFTLPGTVPVGEYDVVVVFGAQPSFVYPGRLLVEEGVRHEVRCNPGTQLCSYLRSGDAP
ncbi:MAG: serine/threonine-protein kinase [Myxococcota bacterium]